VLRESALLEAEREFKTRINEEDSLYQLLTSEVRALVIALYNNHALLSDSKFSFSSLNLKITGRVRSLALRLKFKLEYLFQEHSFIEH